MPSLWLQIPKVHSKLGHGKDNLSQSPYCDFSALFTIHLFRLKNTAPSIAHLRIPQEDNFTSKWKPVQKPKQEQSNITGHFSVLPNCFLLDYLLCKFQFLWSWYEHHTHEQTLCFFCFVKIVKHQLSFIIWKLISFRRISMACNCGNDWS